MKPKTPPPGAQPIAGLRQLSDVTPPSALVTKVMRDIAQPPGFQLWNWLSKPRAVQFRLSPLAALCGALAFGLAGWVAQERLFKPAAMPSVASESPPPATPDTEVVLVRFVLNTHGARSVAVAGDFNGWDPSATPLQMQPQSDVFAVTLPLRKGQAYQYMFWVDGAWVADPSAELRPDGFGQQNSVLRL